MKAKSDFTKIKTTYTDMEIEAFLNKTLKRRN